MDITLSQEQARVPVTVVHLSGDIDSASYQQFERKAKEALAAGAGYMLVDLTKVPYLSSAGLRALNEIFHQLRAQSKDVSEAEMRQGISAGTYKSPNLKLLNPPAGVLEVLKTAGYDMFLEIHTDLKKALASF